MFIAKWGTLIVHEMIAWGQKSVLSLTVLVFTSVLCSARPDGNS